ncbi:MAG: amylo-alpha-1,6-glucosidase [Nitrospirales bacterium]|nr:MAG: amylo-alpha-1,6-glucosidase [Nitrospirales bacterium]
MGNNVIEIGSEQYILATSALVDNQTRVLKHGETFGIFNPYGDIQQIGRGGEGIYHEGTRFLSRFELSLGETHPGLLSSTIRLDNSLLAVDLTNAEFHDNEQTFLPHGTLHISRAKILWQARCFERIRFANYSLESLVVSFSVLFEADFSDIFEVRGEKRSQRGHVSASLRNDKSVVLQYVGLDGISRATYLKADPVPSESTTQSFLFELALQPKEEKTFDIEIACAVNDHVPESMAFIAAQDQAGGALETAKERFCTIDTGNEQFNDWLNRSFHDICMMTTDLPEGLYPYAGVPWFSTVFGRDGIITALECLWINPDLARGVLSNLASTQASEICPEQEAEPGKILHETRKGEMAALKEIPFGHYYGSIDSTPLFIILAGAYYDRTGDKDFIKTLWPNLNRALAWIDHYGDKDQDGFVEYLGKTPNGLTQQGWKDSYDSVFHADGTLAEGPIALCEVQGYVYAAKLAASKVATVLGYTEQAQELRDQANALQAQFIHKFWSDELGTYILALDGNKQPCQVRSTNAGHTLFTGIAKQEHAERIYKGLLRKESSSGWGIRTIPTDEIRYNPMAYHNGSVWPHDNALIAYGMSRYGFTDGIQEILRGLFDMSVHSDLHRLPELICGFERRPGEGPILYPVACAPQSWAAGAVFLLVQASLGISFHGADQEIRFTKPYLPEFLPSLQLQNLRIGNLSADLEFTRKKSDVMIHVTRKDDPLNIVAVK